MRSVGIVGGSFNPPHTGHFHVANEAKRLLGTDEIWLWVSRNIFKDAAEYAPLDMRMQACGVMARKHDHIKPVGIEKDFYDTMTTTSMTTLSALYPKTRFIWIFGDDNFASFHTWDRKKFEIDNTKVQDWQYLMHKFPVAVMHRPGYRAAARMGVAATYGQKLFVEDPRDMAKGQSGWSFVNNTTTPESSSAIKRALVRGERGLERLGLDPDVEDLTYKNGLFGVPGGAPNTNRFPDNAEVRFDTFITLARVAHLCKSMMNPGDAGYFLNYADASWEKSVAKGDLGKKGDVPGEIADVLISAYWLCSPRQISLPGPQATITQWCDDHYPNQNTKERLECLIEELAELCTCEGLEKHRMRNLMTEAFKAPDIETPQNAAAALYATLNSYAQTFGQGLQDMLADKMQINLMRDTRESGLRLAAKQALFRRKGLTA